MSPLLIFAAGLFKDTSFLCGEAVLAVLADFAEDVVDRVFGGVVAIFGGIVYAQGRPAAEFWQLQRLGSQLLSCQPAL